MKNTILRAAFGAVFTVCLVSVAHGAETLTRTSAFEYDAQNGLLTKEIIEPNDTNLCVATTHGYDIFGNKSSITTANCASFTPDASFASRTTTTTYQPALPGSPAGQFPTNTTNALGHTEVKAFDPNFGNVTSLTGPNGLTTTWAYDGFGRKTLETRADGTKTQWEYRYCNGINGDNTTCPTNLGNTTVAWVVITTQLASNNAVNGPYSKAYFDILGREVGSETQGFDGSGSSTVIRQDKYYNNLGQVIEASRPHYAGQTRYVEKFEYDAIQRPYRQLAQDEIGTWQATTTTYAGLVTTITNPKSQARTTTKNSQGQVIEVRDAYNQATSFTYDAFGNLKTTADAAGNVTTLTYDPRGRKTGMSDPNMGVWSYVYNALGELIRQTNAKGQVSLMKYDKLGRMTERSEADLISNWYYDYRESNGACPKGIGKLCQAKTTTGYNRLHNYDSLGRPVSTNSTIDTTYNDSMAYDANTGRVASRTYPGGVVIAYKYTALGYLQSVHRNNITTGQKLWQADIIDALGRPTQQTYGQSGYGGAIPVNHVYNAFSSRMTGITAGAGNSVQNLTYTFDAIGNVTARNDNANPAQIVQESFGYDSLNRLTSSTVNSSGAGTISKSYTFNANGNVTSRSDVGSYVYNPSGVGSVRPHAVNRVNIPGGAYRTYGYDANGNLWQERHFSAAAVEDTSQRRTYAFTSFDMPSTLQRTAGNLSLAFSYGPEHQRIVQTSTSQGTTIYLNPGNNGEVFYEKDIKAGGAIEQRNFVMAGSAVVAIIKQDGTNAVTQTRWLYRDALGSTTAITDETGVTVERLSYEPYGKRRFATGADDPTNSINPQNTERGYTFHEHLDELGIIHMNGRIYDPWLGRFMSADPFIQDPYNTQSLNRYAYVMNNPLMYTDPSGYFSFKKLFRTVVAIYIAYAIGVDTSFLFGGPSGAGGIFGAAAGANAVGVGIANGFAGGFAGGFVGSGGNVEAAFRGGLSGAIFGGIGAYGNQVVNGAARFGTVEFVAAHAAAGCVLGATTGGGCGPQALSAGFAKWATITGPDLGGDVANGVKAVVIGGTASVLGGGKFENGAATAAYAYLFNQAATYRDPRLSMADRNGGLNPSREKTDEFEKDFAEARPIIADKLDKTGKAFIYTAAFVAFAPAPYNVIAVPLSLIGLSMDLTADLLNPLAIKMSTDYAIDKAAGRFPGGPAATGVTQAIKDLKNLTPAGKN